MTMLVSSNNSYNIAKVGSYINVPVTYVGSYV